MLVFGFLHWKLQIE